MHLSDWKAQRMVILVYTISLGSDNLICVVFAIYFMPSAWDRCPALAWVVGTYTLQDEPPC